MPSRPTAVRKPRLAARPTVEPIGSPPSWRLMLRKPSETTRLGRTLGRLLQGGEVLALYGELGAGKTCLIKGLAAGLRAAPAEVSSPTFTLIHDYAGRLRLIHADLYRLTAAQLGDIGLEDYVDGRHVLAVEWADRWGAGLPMERLDLHLAHHRPTGRVMRITAHGASAAALLSALRRRMTRTSPPGVPRPTRVQLPRSRRASH